MSDSPELRAEVERWVLCVEEQEEFTFYIHINRSNHALIIILQLKGYLEGVLRRTIDEIFFYRKP